MATLVLDGCTITLDPKLSLYVRNPVYYSSEAVRCLFINKIMEKTYQVTFINFKTSKEADEFTEKINILYFNETGRYLKNKKIKENGNLILELSD